MLLIKDGKIPIQLDKERHLLFSMYVYGQLRKKYGSIEKWGNTVYDDKDVDFDPIIWALTQMLNEAVDNEEEHLTERQVSKMVHFRNIGYVQKVLAEVMGLSVNGEDNPDEKTEADADDEEDEEKNAQSGQGK